MSVPLLAVCSPGSNRARMTVTLLVSGELALAIGVK